jgi:hypothetical protein
MAVSALVTILILFAILILVAVTPAPYDSRTPISA